MNNLYDALEICLQDIEQGADIETVLFRYPDLAEELRPILEASVQAKGLAVSAPSANAVRRNRAKLLQHAAELREGQVKPSARRFWFASLRRVAVTLVVLALLFASGTGLVRAASTTLPGDNLYPVKRTWEDVLLLFTFNAQARESLELEHENERLEEVHELFTESRSEEVDFAGYVTRQNGNEWRVAGITVVISSQTRLPDQPVVLGSPVRVRGQTQGDWIVLAERIELLSSGTKVPAVQDDESEPEEEDRQGPNQQNEDNSGPGSGDEGPEVEETETPESESESQNESSNSGSGSDNSGSGSDDNGNDNDGSDNTNDNSGSGSDDDDDNSHEDKSQDNDNDDHSEGGDDD